ncbi:MAG: YIP1 family protein [Gammaproteobacteria bacterium]|nr:YIP1 family protein [Gammaproteobacteria bacterium]
MTTLTATPMVMLDVFVAPQSLFERFSSAKKWSWLALLILITLVVGSSYVFFNGMSEQWLIEQQLMHAGDMTPAERNAAMEMMQQTAKYTGLLGGIFGSIFQVVITAIFAGYFMLSSKLFATKSPDFRYGDWFSFSVWTQMPMVISTLGFIALFMTASTGDLPLGLANYASLNQLFLNFEPSHSFYTLTESLNLFSLWSIIIAAIGFKHCCEMPFAKALAVSAMPYLICFGLWFAVI